MDFTLFQQINSLAGRWLWLDTIVIFCADFLIWYLPVLAVLFYFFANREKRKKYRQHLIGIILIMLLTWLINQLVGLIYFRPRPYVTHPAIKNLLVTVYSKKSFPSDHAALAFVLSLVIMKIEKRAGILLFILACLIGLARIFGGVHYPTDILGGLLVAILSTWLVRKFIITLKH